MGKEGGNKVEGRRYEISDSPLHYNGHSNYSISKYNFISKNVYVMSITIPCPKREGFSPDSECGCSQSKEVL
jgi:hypothetical protein